jgi:hypothetical protein
MISAIVLSAMLLDPPNPGSLPFPLPQLPPIPVLEAPEPELAELEHSEDFEEHVEQYETMIEQWSEPLNDMREGFQGMIDDFPDTEGGDVNMPYEPFDDYDNSAINFAVDVGEKTGSLVSYTMAFKDLVRDVLGIVIGGLTVFLLACGIWLVVVRAAIIIYKFARFLVVCIVTLWNAFFAAAPTGG